MSQRPVYVRAHALWLQTLDVPAWLEPFAHGRDVLPAASLLPVRARGRASLVTRVLAEVLEQVTRARPALRTEAPLFCGSRYGEISILDALLTMANEADGALSPARFQASVHNAGAGQLSIALGNRNMSTSIAGGADTVAACLDEAWAWLMLEGGDALVLMADEPVPTRLTGSAHEFAMGVGLWLSTDAPTDETSALRLTLRDDRGAARPPLDLPATLRSGNPLTPSVDLMHALVVGESATVTLSHAPMTTRCATLTRER